MEKLFSSSDLPRELDGFAGGMGYLSIQSISEYDLGFDCNMDVKGYISEPIKGVYYAEVMDGYGNSEYACGEIDEMQNWVTDTVYKFCTD